MGSDGKLRLVFLGPPGSGKGTAADALCGIYGLQHVSTGDMLRSEVASGSALGSTVKALIDSGQLVPDQVVLKLIETSVLSGGGKNGFILDGFPRTLEQAEALDQLLLTHGLELSGVIEFKITYEALADRIVGRLTHPGSGRLYHIKYRPPKEHMKDDVTGEPLVIRPDDTVEMLEDRLKVYESKTKPVSAYYMRTNRLMCIDSGNEIPTVLKHMTDIIEQLSKPPTSHDD